MHNRLAAINDLRRPEHREILQPKACGFRFAMAELPRLNQLRGGAMAVLMMLTGFSMHQRSIGAAISNRTKSSASA